jgi:hypothetical protein
MKQRSNSKSPCPFNRFKYETRRKCYYVNGHEKPETKKYRKTMVSKYLKNELRMYRWIQLPSTELKDLEEELEIKIGNGYHYTDLQTIIEMVELHVDSHPSFHAKMNKTTQFGGQLSVRMPPNTKPVICFGQDECIFKPFIFTSKAWASPDGQKPVIPKDKGQGVARIRIWNETCRCGSTKSQQVQTRQTLQ